MSNSSSKKPVVVYGASGYTGRLVCEYLREYNIPFIAAGRSAEKIQTAMQSNVAGIETASYDVVEVKHSTEALTQLFKGASVVLNTVGPFAKFGHEVVQACLAAKCHYSDTTGEQDWLITLDQEYGGRFAAAGLLLSPGLAQMYTTGEIAAQLCLETPGLDTLDIAVFWGGSPTIASTQTILVNAATSKAFFLHQNKMVEWQPDAGLYSLAIPGQHAMALDEREEVTQVRFGHDDDSPAQCHHRQAQHTGRMGERRQRQVAGPAAEGIAHEREGRHGLQVAAGEHHALGPAGGAAGAGDHGHVVGRRNVDGLVGQALQPFVHGRGEGLLLVQAHHGAQLRKLRAHLLHHGCVVAVEDQAGAVEGIEHIGVLARLVARVDGAPHAARARNAEHGGEGMRIVARQHRHLVAGPDAGALQAARHAPAQALHLRIAQVALAHREARRIGAQLGALVQVVDEAHFASSHMAGDDR